MAKIVKRTKKDGSSSFLIRVSNGYDRNGKQVMQSMTYTPPAGLTGRKLEKRCSGRPSSLKRRCMAGLLSMQI